MSIPRVLKWKEVVDGVEVEVLEFNDTVETVEKASILSGEPSNHIVKTLLLKVGRGFIVVVARGDRRIDYKKISRLLNSSVSLAKASEVKDVLSLEVGAVTPLSPRVKSLKVLLDPAILQNDYVLCGGGAINRLYKVKTSNLIQYLRPEIVDVFV
ncbi:MAG: YbaK/EbsC family protein [Ignisphaera sp.]|uniref:YbaK/EbsC family protein n=1 Tax=Ignisphaera aggregans TaxID=334771 RepID=A0A7C4JJT8_9CREN